MTKEDDIIKSLLDVGKWASLPQRSTRRPSSSEKLGAEGLLKDEGRTLSSQTTQHTEPINNEKSVAGLYKVLNTDIKETIDSLKLAEVLRLQVSLNGVKFWATVDSGAQYSIIEENELKKIINPTVRSKETRIKGIGDPGTYVTSHEKVALQVAIGGIDCELCEFIIVPQLKEKIILGMPLLTGAGLKVNAAEGRVSHSISTGLVENVYFSQDFQENIRTVSPVPVYVVETITTGNDWNPVRINWRSHPFLKRKGVNCNEMWLVEARQQKKDNKKFRIAPGLIHLGALNPIILVKKTTVAPLKLKKGDLIGEISLVTEMGNITCSESSSTSFIGDIQTIKSTSSTDNQVRKEWTKDKLCEELSLMDELTMEEKQKIINLLFNYRSVLSQNDMDIGWADMTPFKIKLKDNFPIYMKPRRTNPECLV